MRSVLQQCHSHRHRLSPPVCLVSIRNKHWWQDNRTKFQGLPEAETRSDQHKTYRIRRHGNKELPLPPMLDPAIHKQRMSYTKLDQQKWGRDVRKVKFRNELFANPYAAALVTPVRHCQWTGARLPRHFLQRMRIYADETGRRIRWRPCREEDVEEQDELEVEDGEEKRSEDLTGHSSYIASHSAIVGLTNKRKQWTRLLHQGVAQHVGERFATNPGSSNLKDRFDWDKGIEDEIAREMARTVHVEWRKLLQGNPELVLVEDHVTALENVQVFVQPAEEIMRVITHSGRPLYRLPLSTAGDDGTHGIKAIMKHHNTIPFILAMDRLIAYLESCLVQQSILPAPDSTEPP